MSPVPDIVQSRQVKPDPAASVATVGVVQAGSFLTNFQSTATLVNARVMYPLLLGAYGTSAAAWDGFLYRLNPDSKILCLQVWRLGVGAKRYRRWLIDRYKSKIG